MCKWGVKVPYYNFVTVNFPFYVCQCFPYILRCSCVGACLPLLCHILGLIHWSLCNVLSSLLIFFILRFNLYDKRIVALTFIKYTTAWNVFFHPLTFSLYISLSLEWVSCTQHIYGSSFCIHWAIVSWWAHLIHLKQLLMYICAYWHFLNCVYSIFIILFLLVLPAYRSTFSIFKIHLF